MKRLMSKAEDRSFSPWPPAKPPTKILVIRFQAIGDVVVTLPACMSLRKSYPEARIDILTSANCAPIPGAIRLFDHMFSDALITRRWHRLWSAVRRGLQLRRERYDVILDLQRHRSSRIIRHLAHPHAWGEFDRHSPRHALDRVLDTFHRAGFADVGPDFSLEIRGEILDRSRRILRENGWDGKARLVILNPAGAWATRNWPLPHYKKFADLWSATEGAQYLIVGTEKIRAKADLLSSHLGKRAINLTGRTTLAEAMGLVQHVSVVISEDSGLLHMAWVSGVPVVALLGSTRSDWTRPLGPRSRYLASEDLPCGACMKPECAIGDVPCMSRHLPETVLLLAREVAGTCSGG
jgi:heptosyltransferase-2